MKGAERQKVVGSIPPKHKEESGQASGSLRDKHTDEVTSERSAASAARWPSLVLSACVCLFGVMGTISVVSLLDDTNDIVVHEPLNEC